MDVDDWDMDPWCRYSPVSGDDQHLLTSSLAQDGSGQFMMFVGSAEQLMQCAKNLGLCPFAPPPGSPDVGGVGECFHDTGDDCCEDDVSWHRLPCTATDVIFDFADEQVEDLRLQSTPQTDCAVSCADVGCLTDGTETCALPADASTCCQCDDMHECITAEVGCQTCDVVTVDASTQVDAGYDVYPCCQRHEDQDTSPLVERRRRLQDLDFLHSHIDVARAGGVPWMPVSFGARRQVDEHGDAAADGDCGHAEHVLVQPTVPLQHQLQDCAASSFGIRHPDDFESGSAFMVALAGTLSDSLEAFRIKAMSTPPDSPLGWCYAEQSGSSAERDPTDCARCWMDRADPQLTYWYKQAGELDEYFSCRRALLFWRRARQSDVSIGTFLEMAAETRRNVPLMSVSPPRLLMLCDISHHLLPALPANFDDDEQVPPGLPFDQGWGHFQQLLSDALLWLETRRTPLAGNQTHCFGWKPEIADQPPSKPECIGVLRCSTYKPEQMYLGKMRMQTYKDIRVAEVRFGVLSSTRIALYYVSRSKYLNTSMCNKPVICVSAKALPSSAVPRASKHLPPSTQSTRSMACT